MVQEYTAQDNSSSRSRCSGKFQRDYSGERSFTLDTNFGKYSYHGGYLGKQLNPYSATELKLRWTKKAGSEV